MSRIPHANPLMKWLMFVSPKNRFSEINVNEKIKIPR
jgi:hypothetical protein